MKLRIIATLATGVYAIFAINALAQQPAPLEVPCPSEEPCSVLVLTATEIKVLTADAGILATAAQARNLDLGQYVAYFRQKIALAPAGKNIQKAPLASEGSAGAPTEKKPEEAPKKP